MHRLFEEQGRKEGHFSVRFGSQEGTLARILTSQGGSLVCFANQEGTLACFFGSQEGILACVFQQLGHRGGGDCLCTSLLPCTLYCVYERIKSDLTQTEECSSASVPSEPPKQEGAERVSGCETHHHKANVMDPQSTRGVVLHRNTNQIILCIEYNKWVDRCWTISV